MIVIIMLEIIIISQLRVMGGFLIKQEVSFACKTIINVIGTNLNFEYLMIYLI